MPICTIDGIQVEFEPGENLIEIAKRVNCDIPYFCYHKGLSIVAQCRMCAIEVENVPKIQTACSTPASDGMVIHTKSKRVLDARKSVMEFLLINHPLDCPICDQAGECDLQDFSYDHGSAYQRYTEERRTFVDLDMGPVIKKSMNRCIHCTRCIRFGEEISKTREMVALKRGNSTEITTIDGRPLESEYAGNYADICPTGSLTLKDFRFNKRVWFLKKTPTICEGCSRGCNVELHHDRGIVYRTVPRENMEINKFWMCDEGRFNFRYIHDESRVTSPLLKGKKIDNGWSSGITQAKEILKEKKLAILVGSDLTNEEMVAIKTFSEAHFPDSSLYHYGTSGVESVGKDKDSDSILRRKSKTSNLNGAEELGLRGVSSVPGDAKAVLVFRGGRAALPEIDNQQVVAVGVFAMSSVERFDVVLPGVTFAEKSGTVVNCDGIKQKYVRAVVPPVGTKEIQETLMLIANSEKKSGVN